MSHFRKIIKGKIKSLLFSQHLTFASPFFFFLPFKMQKFFILEKTTSLVPKSDIFSQGLRNTNY